MFNIICCSDALPLKHVFYIMLPTTDWCYSGPPMPTDYLLCAYVLDIFVVLLTTSLWHVLPVLTWHTIRNTEWGYLTDQTQVLDLEYYWLHFLWNYLFIFWDKKRKCQLTSFSSVCVMCPLWSELLPDANTGDRFDIWGPTLLWKLKRDNNREVLLCVFYHIYKFSSNLCWYHSFDEA